MVGVKHDHRVLLGGRGGRDGTAAKAAGRKVRQVAAGPTDESRQAHLRAARPLHKGPRHHIPDCYDRAVDRTGLRAWVELYERAWRTAGTELLAGLFAPEATYQTAPFEEPFRGLPAIAAMWRAGRATRTSPCAAT